VDGSSPSTKIGPEPGINGLNVLCSDWDHTENLAVCLKTRLASIRKEENNK